jgi:hypothetical protein
MSTPAEGICVGEEEAILACIEESLKDRRKFCNPCQLVVLPISKSTHILCFFKGLN